MTARIDVFVCVLRFSFSRFSFNTASTSTHTQNVSDRIIFLDDVHIIRKFHWSSIIIVFKCHITLKFNNISKRRRRIIYMGSLQIDTFVRGFWYNCDALSNDFFIMSSWLNKSRKSLLLWMILSQYKYIFPVSMLLCVCMCVTEHQINKTKTKYKFNITSHHFPVQSINLRNRTIITWCSLPSCSIFDCNLPPPPYSFLF